MSQGQSRSGLGSLRDPGGNPPSIFYTKNNYNKALQVGKKGGHPKEPVWRAGIKEPPVGIMAALRG